MFNTLENNTAQRIRVRPRREVETREQEESSRRSLKGAMLNLIRLFPDDAIQELKRLGAIEESNNNLL